MPQDQIMPSDKGQADHAHVAADTILLGGHIHSNAADKGAATAVALTGHRITAIGSDSDVRKTASPSTQYVDLAGRSVFAGFQDAHIHACTAPSTASPSTRVT